MLFHLKCYFPQEPDDKDFYVSDRTLWWNWKSKIGQSSVVREGKKLITEVG